MLRENKDVDIICENLRDLNERSKLISEQKKLFCELLANYVTDPSTPPEELQEAMRESAVLLERHSDGQNGSDALDLIYEVASKVGFSPALLLDGVETYQIFSRTKPAKIVYVKNNYSDAAFVRFSRIFENPKVSYKTNFEDACEDVYNAAGDYCILPIENENGGKLFTFYSLIDKYDLKIFAVCDLYEANGEHRTRYALLSKNNIVHLEKAKQGYIEFSIIAENASAIKDILGAAERCGLELYRIDTVSVPYDDSTFRFYLVFESLEGSAVPFIIYLNLRYPQHETIGYYILL